MDEMLKYLRAMVALQVANLTKGEQAEPIKVEILLARAGIPVKEIADLLGKNPAAVAKAIQRAKHAGRNSGDVAAPPVASAESAA